MSGSWESEWNGQYNKLDGVYCADRGVFNHQELGKYIYHVNGYWLTSDEGVHCDSNYLIEETEMRVFDDALYLNDISSVWQEFYQGQWVDNPELVVKCQGWYTDNLKISSDI